jgi:lambda family phage portal protein
MILSNFLNKKNIPAQQELIPEEKKELLHIEDVPITAIFEFVSNAVKATKNNVSGIEFTNISGVPYYLLREKMRRMYQTNLFVTMLIDGMVTNIINKGLQVECSPDQNVLKLKKAENYFNEWKLKTESYYELWSGSQMPDQQGIKALGELEQTIFREALIEGDVLYINRADKKTGLPKIDIINARRVGSILTVAPLSNNKIIDGVEINSYGEQVAYWVQQDDDFYALTEPVRIARFGEKTGRQMAGLIYWEPLAAGKVRGTPFIASIVKEIEYVCQYTDFELIAAKINASLAMMVEKTQNIAGSQPLEGVQKRITVPTSSVARPPISMMPGGMIIHELNYGEKPTSFKTDRPNVNFKTFVECMINFLCAAKGIPPEIVLLKFDQNYSASRQATIEHGIFIEKYRSSFSNQFSSRIFKEWFTVSVLMHVIEADGYVEAMRKEDFYTLLAWQKANYLGVIKPHVDQLSEAKAVTENIKNGLTTRERAAAKFNGSDYNQNVAILKNENKLLADANEDLIAAENPVAPTESSNSNKDEGK